MKTNNNVFEVNMVGNKGMMSDSNNNAVINLGGVYLGIDAGITVKQGYEQAGIQFTDIDYLFFTHADPDHAQIVYFLQNTFWQFPNGVHTPHKPTLLVLPEQEEWIDAYTKYTLGTQGLTLQDFVHYVIVEDYTYNINGYKLDFVDTTSLHCQGMQSFGLVATHVASNQNLVYTSDIKRLEDSSFKQYVHDKTCAIFQDTHASGDPVHAGLNEVLAYYPESAHHLLHLMHLTGNFSVHEETMKEKNIVLTEAGKWYHFK